MKTHTIEDIRKLKPCYDPAKYLPEDWTGTALDILNVVAAPAKDRLWVVLKPSWIDERTARLFMDWCTSGENCWFAANTNIWATPVAAAWAATRDAPGDAAWDAAWDTQVEKLKELLG